jgi:hypothetical protein
MPALRIAKTQIMGRIVGRRTTSGGTPPGIGRIFAVGTRKAPLLHEVLVRGEELLSANCLMTIRDKCNESYSFGAVIATILAKWQHVGFLLR